MDGSKPGRVGRTKRRRVGALSALSIVLSATLSWAEGAPNHVRDVRVHAADGAAGAAEIEVVGTGSPTFSVRVDEGGKRLLIDLTHADLAGAPPAITTREGPVGGVLTQAFRTSSGSVTRLSVSLTQRATYRLRADGSTLRITLTPSDAQGPAAAPNAPSELEPVDPVALPAKGEGAPNAVQDVRFERVPPRRMVADARDKCGAGCDRIIVAVTKLPGYAMTTSPSGRLRLELKKTRLPEALARGLDVSAYRGGIRSVSSFYDGATGSAIVEVDRSGDDPGNLYVEDGKLVWAFAVPGDVASPILKGAPSTAVRHTMTVAREPDAPDVPRVHSSIREMESEGDLGGKVETTGASEAGFLSTVSAQASAPARYAGRRIDLDLKDADIHNILRLLADVGRVNIVTADDVSGNVTIRMRNVPWDQALDVVLQAKGLGMVHQGNLIRVAPMSQLQKERELRLAAAKQELELTPLETRLVPVSYATADELQARAKDLLSPRGTLAVDERTNMLIARDVPGNLDRVEELVHSLDTQTPEVLVEARIVEATSRYVRDIGIQWGGDATFSEATGNPTGIAFPSRVGVAGGNYDSNTPTAGLSPFNRAVNTPNFAVNLPAAVGTGQGGALGLTFGSIDNALNLGVRLSAAEASGMVRIVSSPRILTLDNREARINQGTLIPFAQISAQGVQTTFQEAKLQLLVKPHVTADGSVAMHVKINRDEPDFNQTSARGDPTILKREAETDLLVMDGHTAVIGGIYTRNTGRNLDQVPFFGDIPILGILFQRRRANDSRNELVIFLTPRIVNRAEALGR